MQGCHWHRFSILCLPGRCRMPHTPRWWKSLHIIGCLEFWSWNQVQVHRLPYLCPLLEQNDGNPVCSVDRWPLFPRDWRQYLRFLLLRLCRFAVLFHWLCGCFLRCSVYFLHYFCTFQQKNVFFP